MSNKSKISKAQELQNKCEEYLNGWKRAQADYQNLKREKEREREDWLKYANAGLIMELLPVYDNLKLALEHVPEEQRKLDWVIGIEHIKNQFISFLNNLGVEEIEVKEGDEFDPEVMEAVEETENNKQSTINKGEIHGQFDLGGKTEDKEQLVKKIMKAGYRIKGKVIVPAKVVVD